METRGKSSEKIQPATELAANPLASISQQEHITSREYDKAFDDISALLYNEYRKFKQQKIQAEYRHDASID